MDGLWSRESRGRRRAGFTIVALALVVAFGARLAVSGAHDNSDHLLLIGVLAVAVVVPLVAGYAAGAAVGLAFATAGAAAVALVVPAPGIIGSFFVLLAASILVMWFVAAYFTPRTIRIVVVALVVLHVIVIAGIGRAEIAKDRLASARGIATHLDNQLAQSTAEAMKATDGAIADATTSLADLVAASAAAGDSEVKTAAKAVENDLRGVLGESGDAAAAGMKGASAALDDINRKYVPAESVVATGALVDSARSAVAAAQAFLKSQALSTMAATSAQSKIASVCSDAGGMLVAGDSAAIAPVSAEACQANPKAQAAPRPLGTDTADAELALAELRAASGKDSDEADVLNKEAALGTARAQDELPLPGADAEAVVARGGAEIVRGIPGFHREDVPIAVTLAGWALLAAALVTLLRLLTRRSAKNGIGPVTIGTVTGDDKVDLVAPFRMHVLQNVPEPGSLPGGGEAPAVTDLLETVGGPAGKFLKPLLQYLLSAIAPPVGYTVDASYQMPLPGASGANAHRVYVRIQDAGSKSTKVVAQQSGETVDLALRAGGYWAAGWILSRSDVVPDWSKWNEDTAGALADYLDPRAGATIEDCEEAAKRAPDSGLVLTQLGNRYALEGAHRDAFRCYLRASTLYPRFPVARYRLAVSMGLLASDIDQTWWTANPADRIGLVEELKRFGHATGMSPELINRFQYLRVPAPGQDAVEVLCDAATKQLENLEKLVGKPSLWWQWLDQAERRYWQGLLWGREVRHLRWIVKSAALVMQARAAGQAVPQPSQSDEFKQQLRAVIQEATRHDASWQVLYNLACYHAVASGDSLWGATKVDALNWLEKAASWHDSEALSGDWLSKDPDLVSLVDEPRFVRLVQSIRENSEKVS